MNNPPKPVKELKKFLHSMAVRLHKNRDSFEKSEFRVVSGTSDYHVQTTVTITHIALSPTIFGAIFKVEGWRYYFRTLNKTVSVNFLIVVPQVTTETPITNEMVKVFKTTPSVGEIDFTTLASGFRQFIISGWTT